MNRVIVPMMSSERIFAMVEAELHSARTKFPDTKHLLHAFTEEAGEVTRAFLQLHYHKGSREDVLKELIQTIAMAMRLLQEGDPDFPGFRTDEGIML
jgi:NTP pyrophosphatase (non-canonical NTP hydrolase)